MIDRQLALFLDGDWADASQDTALRQLCGLVRNDVVQTFYEGGSPNRDPVLDLALRAYLWLCERYRDGTDVYLFGFSAGGIAALRLARIIAIAGLLRLPDESLLQRVREWDAEVPRYLSGDLTVFRQKYSRTVRIRFLGLLDPAGPFGLIHEVPVDSVNEEWIADGRLNPIISHAFSALAVDETSDLYRPIQWTHVSRHTRSAKQVWFRGSHLDMGRAFSVQNNPLGLFPFLRLANEAVRRGLALRPRWQGGFRRARRSITRWVSNGDGLITQAVPPLPAGQLERGAGPSLYEEFDFSLLDQTISRAIGALPERFRGPRPAAPSSMPLSEADEVLFLLNDMKPPETWGRDRPQDEDVPGSVYYLQDRWAAPVSPEYPRFGIAALREPKPPRFLLARFSQRAPEDASLVAGQLEPDRATWLWVCIGPANPNWLSASGGEGFPDWEVQNRKSDELTVVLSGCSVLPGPQMQHILLPKRGTSTMASFALGSMTQGSVFNARPIACRNVIDVHCCCGTGMNSPRRRSPNCLGWLQVPSKRGCLGLERWYGSGCAVSDSTARSVGWGQRHDTPGSR